MGASSSTPAGVGVGIPEGSLDFSFGFDNATYSDRTLLIQIVNDYNTSTTEEVSLMDLLKYVYGNNLSTTRATLLDLLVIADKFEVATCMRYCTQLLINMPMTCESALLYLDLSPSLVISPTVQSLVNAAKQFLIEHLCDFDKRKEEILDLILAGIKVVLSCDDLQVTSEGVVYDSVLKWVHERREILKTHLLDLVHFPFMTVPQLIEEVQTCSDIDPDLASQIVIHALCFKVETPHRKRCLATKEDNVVSRQFVARAYNQSIKVAELKSPDQYCIVFLHRTKKELTHILLDSLMSETFHLGKQKLVFDGKCCLDKHINAHYFLLALEVVGLTTTFQVKYEIAVKKKPKPLEKFVRWKKGRQTFTETTSLGQIVSAWWTNLINR